MPTNAAIRRAERRLLDLTSSYRWIDLDQAGGGVPGAGPPASVGGTGGGVGAAGAAGASDHLTPRGP